MAVKQLALWGELKLISLNRAENTIFCFSIETIRFSNWQDKREISERCSLLLHHIAGRLFPSSLGEKFVPSQLAFCNWQLARTQPQVSIDEDTLNLYPEHVCLDGT